VLYLAGIAGYRDMTRRHGVSVATPKQEIAIAAVAIGVARSGNADP
jgi:hypothetical protein